MTLLSCRRDDKGRICGWFLGMASGMMIGMDVDVLLDQRATCGDDY